MTQAHLVACSGCTRHVRVSESSCPFCGSVLGDALRATPAPIAPRGRLSRAARAAIGVGSVAAAVACGGRVVGELPDGAMADAEQTAVPYGVAPFDDASSPPPPDAGGGGHTVPSDAGGTPPEDASLTTDAGKGGHGGFDGGGGRGGFDGGGRGNFDGGLGGGGEFDAAGFFDDGSVGVPYGLPPSPPGG